MRRKNPLPTRTTSHAPDVEVVVDYLRKARLINVIESFLIAKSDLPVEGYDYAIAYSIHAMLERLDTGIYAADDAIENGDRGDEMIDNIDKDIEFTRKARG